MSPEPMAATDPPDLDYAQANLGTEIAQISSNLHSANGLVIFFSVLIPTILIPLTFNWIEMTQFKGILWIQWYIRTTTDFNAGRNILSGFSSVSSVSDEPVLRDISNSPVLRRATLPKWVTSAHFTLLNATPYQLDTGFRRNGAGSAPSLSIPVVTMPKGCLWSAWQMQLQTFQIGFLSTPSFQPWKIQSRSREYWILQIWTTCFRLADLSVKSQSSRQRISMTGNYYIPWHLLWMTDGRCVIYCWDSIFAHEMHRSP